MSSQTTRSTSTSRLRPSLLWAAGILSLSLGLASCGEADTPAAAPQATEVGIVTLQSQALSISQELAGRTVAAESAEIRPQVTGLIEKRLFTEGSQVEAGQALYQIDASSYRIAVASADAAVTKAKATLESARLSAERQASLLAADAGSRQDNEDARAALLQAQADLKSAQASAASARLDLQRTRITAPIAGRIDTSTVTAGALVTANQTTALTTVEKTDPMWVNITQSSTDILKLRQQIAKGDLQGFENGSIKVQVQLEDGSTYAHDGQLQVAGVSVDESTGAVTLRAEVPNPEGLLMPGMYVRVNVAQAQDPAAILAPQAGVQRDTSGGASALVVGAEDKVEKRSVEVAEAHGNQWRVTSGLKDGDRLIVEGTGKVRPGQIVSAVAITSAPDSSSPASASSAPKADSRPAATKVASNP